MPDGLIRLQQAGEGEMGEVEMDDHPFQQAERGDSIVERVVPWETDV